MATRIIGTIGLPASGKSTAAKKAVAEGKGKVARINRDDLRVGLFGSLYKFSRQKEKMVTNVKNHLLQKYVEDPDIHTIWVDETHCSEKGRNSTKEAIKLLELQGHNILFDWLPFEDSFNVDLCHKRNTERENTVPYGVIERMFVGFMDFVRDIRNNKYCPEWLPDSRLYTTCKSRCYIIDVDGTLADHTGVRSPFDWSKVKLDKPKQHVIDIVKRLPMEDAKIVLSGRDGSCYNDTYEWLMENGVSFNKLCLREAGSNEKDYIVKMRMFKEHIQGKYHVAGVFDDRVQICRYWGALGLPLFNIGWNNFF